MMKFMMSAMVKDGDYLAFGTVIRCSSLCFRIHLNFELVFNKKIINTKIFKKSLRFMVPACVASDAHVIIFSFLFCFLL